jgi:1-acyl-sn-glycerol-3-phosphate acyltransferase
MAQQDSLGHPVGRIIVVYSIWLLTKLLLSLKISNFERVPKTGPVVVVINHVGFLDPVLVCMTFVRHIIPLAKIEAFDSFFLRLLLNAYGTIPVRRGEGDIGAVKMALRVLKNGGLILLAPEGTRSPTYQLQVGKEGAVTLALRSGAPIVPIGIIGTQHLKVYWRKFRRAPIHMSVGKPFYLRAHQPDQKVSRAEMMAMTEEMMYRLAAQLPESYRGIYGDLEAATEDHLVSLKS